MGLHGVSGTSIALVVVLLVVVFGGKRIRHLGGDLAKTWRDFQRGLKGDKKDGPPDSNEPS